MGDLQARARVDYEFVDKKGRTCIDASDKARLKGKAVSLVTDAPIGIAGGDADPRKVMDFGPVTVNKEALKPKEFTLTNTSDKTIRVVAKWANGKEGFWIGKPAFPCALKKNTSVRVEIRFKPPREGELRDAVLFQKEGAVLKPGDKKPGISVKGEGREG
jgi:hypothetical protein